MLFQKPRNPSGFSDDSKWACLMWKGKSSREGAVTEKALSPVSLDLGTSRSSWSADLRQECRGEAAQWGKVGPGQLSIKCMGSQWREARMEVMRSPLRSPVKRRAAAFWTSWKRDWLHNKVRYSNPAEMWLRHGLLSQSVLVQEVASPLPAA